MMAKTLYDKLWDSHLVHEEKDGTALIYIDRHLVHEVTSPQAYEGLKLAGRKPWRVDSIVATADHNTPTRNWDKGIDGITDLVSRLQVETLDQNIKAFGAKAYFPFLDKRQGIVHVIGPEQGATLPGMTVVCGDSHTSTHGAFAAWLSASAPVRSRARARHAVPGDEKVEEHADRGRRQTGRGRDGQGHRARGDRQDRHRRRHRIRDRVCRQRHARAVDGRPHDRLQHGDRGRRPHRHGGGRRQDHRIRQGQTVRAARRAVGQGGRLLAHAAERRRARSSTRW